MVRGLVELGYEEAFKVSKKKSIMYHILSMKKKRINVVRNHLYKQVKKSVKTINLKRLTVFL